MTAQTIPLSDVELASTLSRHLSSERCIALLQDLVRIPSPQTELLEAEPQLRRFIEHAIEPRLRAIDFKNVRYDAMGNFVARKAATPGPKSVMLVGHAMNQPPATMPDPYSGAIVSGEPFGFPSAVVRGRGASEQKSTLAAMLHALEALTNAKLPLVGEMIFICCVSGETGSHDAIRNVIEAEGIRPDMAFVYGNGNKIQLGNRGRIDMRITVHGKPCHSSRPKEGCNAVTAAADIIRRLAQLDSVNVHPDLGPASLTVNRIRSFPDSTHTVQGLCEISVDRRLLPDNDPEYAATEIENVAMQVDGMPDPVSGIPWSVSVARGAYMYPSLVSRDALPCRMIERASWAMLGHCPEMAYGRSAFDQGYLNQAGIPTINFGPGEENFAHTDNDIARVDLTFDAAQIYAFLLADHLR